MNPTLANSLLLSAITFAVLGFTAVAIIFVVLALALEVAVFYQSGAK